jgi:hypothetical protein
MANTGSTMERRNRRDRKGTENVTLARRWPAYVLGGVGWLLGVGLRSKVHLGEFPANCDPNAPPTGPTLGHAISIRILMRLSIYGTPAH